MAKHMFGHFTTLCMKGLREILIFLEIYIWKLQQLCFLFFFFSNSLKNAIVIPVHKKGAKTSKDNYRSVSILSNISKIYERLIFRKTSEYFEPVLSKF